MKLKGRPRFALILHGCQALSDSAKPGMGVDEGFMIVYNEMQRIIAIKNSGIDYKQ